MARRWRRSRSSHPAWTRSPMWRSSTSPSRACGTSRCRPGPAARPLPAAARAPPSGRAGAAAPAGQRRAAPALGLSRPSTADALAAHQPFVLVVDSVGFKVTPACGKALALAKYLVDRWPDVPFIHLEPYRYDIVTEEAVLQGSLTAPTLVDSDDDEGLGGRLGGR